MADYSYDLPTTPRVQTAREDELVAETISTFTQLALYRNTLAGQLEEVARLVLPEYRNTFFYGNYNWPGQKKTENQIDATGMMANHRFAAICDSLLTPRNMTWHTLSASNPDVAKDRQASLWYERATRTLFQHRYAATANFMGQNHANYLALGAFGTHAMFIDAFDDAFRGPIGLRYISVPLGELFIRQNHQGLVDEVIRWFRYTAKQAFQAFGPERFPENLKPSLLANSETVYDFLHHVKVNKDYDPKAIGQRGMRFSSCYVSVTGRVLVREGGYYSFPFSVGRYLQFPGETMGRGPAMLVLPSLKTLNLEKQIFLKTGHRAADPVLLIGDDGLVDSMSLRPGAKNSGGVNSAGKPLVHILPTGEIQISKEMMDEERALINDAFLVSLFQILVDTPAMSATEVIERTNEKGILLAPTVGRQQDEYLGPMIDRELDILQRQRLLPPMPGILREARGEYQTVYTSPLSKASRAQEAAGFMRAVESSLAVVNATQDPSHLDVYDFDAAGIAIADIQGVPPSYMSSPKQIAQKRAMRAKAAQQQAQIQALPAQAAMMKAQTTVAKGQQGNANQLAGGGGNPLMPAQQGGQQ